MDLAAIQHALKQAGFDGWLFCDFHHRDLMAYKILGLETANHTTRRWFYFVPSAGDPVKLSHKVEPTKLEPLPLLRHTKEIEADLGRKPSFRNAPRPVDIDILFYGTRVVQTPELTIPHPGVATRAFVLAPLSEIAFDLVHPICETRVGDLLHAVSMDGVQVVGRLMPREMTV